MQQEVSTDGETWTPLGSVAVFQDGGHSNTVVNAAAIRDHGHLFARYVRVTPEAAATEFSLWEVSPQSLLKGKAVRGVAVGSEFLQSTVFG